MSDRRQLLELLDDFATEFADGIAALSPVGAHRPNTDGEPCLLSRRDYESSLANHIALDFEPDESSTDGSFQIIIELAEARSIAAALRGANVLEARSGTELDAADHDELAKVGSMAAELAHTALQKALGDDVGMRFEAARLAEPPAAHEEFIAYRFAFELEGCDGGGMCRIVIDRATAEQWNGGDVSAAFRSKTPSRGTIACYLADAEPYALVRQACRRVGLDIDNRPVSEVPNPAAYRGKLVLIDVPVRGDKRFQWSKRLKEYEPTSCVVMLIRQPSKQRVVSGYLAKADVILGWPLAESDLAGKLVEVLDKLPAYA